jgi:phospholipid/cholesterol/gamma-HCH transport system substrate-binding protein
VGAAPGSEESMAAKKHDFTKKEILAGLLVLISLAVLLGFVAGIKKLKPPENKVAYHAHFTKTIGLKANAEVFFGGLNAGYVSAMRPCPEDQSQIRVEFLVDPNIPINEKSIATIEQTTLMSERHLEISTGEKNAKRLPPDSEIKSVTLSGGFIDLPDLAKVVSQVEDLLDDVTEFLGVDNAKDLEAKGEQEFARITDITASLKGTLEDGSGLVNDLRGVLEEQTPNISEIMEKVKDIGDSAKDLVGQLNEMLAENREPIRVSLGEVQKILEDVGGVISQVTEDLETLLGALESTLLNVQDLTANARAFLDANRPVIEDVVLDLRETIRYLKSFTRTLAEQPQSILTGKTPEGRK